MLIAAISRATQICDRQDLQTRWPDGPMCRSLSRYRERTRVSASIDEVTVTVPPLAASLLDPIDSRTVSRRAKPVRLG